MTIVSRIPSKEYKDNWDLIFRKNKDAKQEQETSKDHGSGCAQPCVCKENGNSSENCKGIQSGR